MGRPKHYYEVGESKFSWIAQMLPGNYVMILGECALRMCLYVSRFTFYEVTLPNLTGKECQPNSEPSLHTLRRGLNWAG